MHRKTREIPAGQIVAFILMLLAATGLLLGISILGSTQANAATITPWHADHLACQDFHAWQHHRTDARFNRLYRTSRHADTFIRMDVALWRHDRNRDASRAVLALDRGYVAIDCSTLNGYGL
jgi:hypothetical protein